VRGGSDIQGEQEPDGEGISAIAMLPSEWKDDLWQGDRNRRNFLLFGFLLAKAAGFLDEFRQPYLSEAGLEEGASGSNAEKPGTNIIHVSQRAGEAYVTRLVALARGAIQLFKLGEI